MSLKCTAVHPYCGLLLHNEEKQINTGNMLHESLGNYAEWGKKTPKVYRLYDSIDLIFLKWQNDSNMEHISCCLGLGSGWEEKWQVDMVMKGQRWGSSLVMEVFCILPVVETQTCTCDQSAENCTHTHTPTHMSTSETGELWIRWMDCIYVRILVVILYCGFPRG